MLVFRFAGFYILCEEKKTTSTVQPEHGFVDSISKAMAWLNYVSSYNKSP